VSGAKNMKPAKKSKFKGKIFSKVGLKPFVFFTRYRGIKISKYLFFNALSGKNRHLALSAVSRAGTTNSF
jgi:hypothetical protein